MAAQETSDPSEPRSSTPDRGATVTSHSPFPALHIIPPTQPHTHTIIILHGRGSSGPEFAFSLSFAQSSSGKTLFEHFPSYRWLFPTSATRFSTVFQGPLCEWFDIQSLTDPSRRPELQLQGLRESVAYVHRLVKEEARNVDAKRIVLGGISQGSAMGWHALLSSSVLLGGFFGLSTWLPFCAELDAIGTRTEGQRCRGKALVSELHRSILDSESAGWDEKQANSFDTPVFLSHCVDDHVVDVELGQACAGALRKLGLEVRWKDYESGGHWIKSPEGYDDLVAFLEDTAGVDFRG